MDARTLCLGVLMLGRASGYEIKKEFEDGPFAHFHAVSFGSIYPALNTLKAEGLVTCTQMEQHRRPDKKVYSITQSGREAFRRALHKEPAPDSFRSETIFMMFFGEQLDRDHLRQVYDHYCAQYRARLDCMAQQDVTGYPADRRFVHGLGLAVYRASLGYMEQNRDLLFGSSTNGDVMQEEPPHSSADGQPAA